MLQAFGISYHLTRIFLRSRTNQVDKCLPLLGKRIGEPLTPEDFPPALSHISIALPGQDSNRMALTVLSEYHFGLNSLPFGWLVI